MSGSEMETSRVVVGVDTHADAHHVAVLSEYGKPLADREFSTTAGPGLPGSRRVHYWFW